MKLIRNLIIFFSLLSIFTGCLLFYNHLNDGFSLHQITSSLPPCPHYQVPLEPSKKADLLSVLNQNFNYLGKGCQFYAFESEDGKYVIKFLKHKHLRQFTWLKSLPLPTKWRALAEKKITQRKERVDRLFSSCRLAYLEMADLTGLLYIHLDRTPTLSKTLLIKDKVGLRHKINIDEYEYILQKKAISVKEVFAKEALQPEQIQGRLKQLVRLIEARWERGICDRDRSFVQNVAFSAEEDRAIFVDIGQFFKDPSILKEEEQIKDLKKRLGNLYEWTGRYFPHLIPLVQGEETDSKCFLNEERK